MYNVMQSVIINTIIDGYFQVSIVAIQLIGDEVSRGEENNNGHSVVDAGHNNVNSSSVCDDLAFEMYVDKDVAKIIRLMEERKHQAVQGSQCFMFSLKNTVELLLSKLQSLAQSIST